MPGPRVFTLEQAHHVLPLVEEQLRVMDRVRERLGVLKIRINALELIWGSKLSEPDCPDRGEFGQHVADMKAAEQEFEAASRAITELGGHLKGIDPPLVDFYGVREGRLVFWCWKRGEPRITEWHHIDEGFAGRQRV